MTKWYKEDLAYIHDAGFRDYALGSAPGLLDLLRRNKIDEGLVVDLGCGSGLWARELIDASYQVLGIDISQAMIQLARKCAPRADFRVESLFTAAIPQCQAITSIGECLNYLFDPASKVKNQNAGEIRTLTTLFQRVYQALNPGGIFIFDLAEPRQVKPGITSKGFTEGEDWLVLVEKKEVQNILTRKIISFRKIGRHYRRADETHRQQLYRAADVATGLRQIGFRVRLMRRYGDYPLPKAHVAFIARKPA